MYKTYHFAKNEKDPVIDIARTCIEIFAARHNISFNKACNMVAKDSGVTPSCLSNWFYGTVRRPYFATVVAVVHATGREVSVSNHGMGSKARFRPAVIKGGKAA